VDNFESAQNAQNGGADRIELCSSLSEGGLTPSYGFAKTCVEQLSVDIFPMIRPRGGHFVYSKPELQMMLEDIQQFKALGVHGIVVGVLDQSNAVNEIAMRRLINAARPLPVTFHRAFDVAFDPIKALDILVELKVDRLLTSGQQPRAVDGIHLIQSLQERYGDKIKIMAGSGVNHENIAKLKATNIPEFHGSARKSGSSLSDLKEIMAMRSILDR